MNRSILAIAAASSFLFGGSHFARADYVELVNGDLLHGEVVSLDDQDLRLMSDIHGAVIIARDKVAAIGFGDRRPPRPADDTARVNGRVRAAGGRIVAGDGANVTATVPVAPASAQDIVRQLRASGLSPENIAELQKAMPMLKDPGAKRYFDDTVKGLVEGDLNVEDVRKQAIRAREEYRKSVKGLGPEAEKSLNQALGGYLQILDRFIQDASPNATKENQQAPSTESAKQPSPPDVPKQSDATEPPVGSGPKKTEEPR